MKVNHIFGGNHYVITNYSVALNSLFWNEYNCDFFKTKAEFYLSDLCDISAYGLCENQFLILLKTKCRKDFEEFFRKKQGKPYLDAFDVPETGHIFSQEVSNFLNSFVKHINAKYNRQGGMFAGRYEKFLVQNEEELESWKDKINNLEKLREFDDEWKPKPRESIEGREEGKEWRSSRMLYEDELLVDPILRCFKRISEYNLKGCFKHLPPSDYRDSNFLRMWGDYEFALGRAPDW